MDVFFEAVLGWITIHQATIYYIFVTLLVAWLVKKFGDYFVRRAVSRGVRRGSFHSASEERKREQTVAEIISGALHIIIWPIAGIIILERLGVEIAPLIAGAGIVGIAIGFGAQSLVKDIIAGLFIIIENQYRVGDVVDLGDVSGLVEHISLRVTVLRDLDGIVHHVPNGTITHTSNYSKDFSGINLNIGVAYDSNLDQVIKIINTVGKKLSQEAEWQTRIIEPPAFLRVDNLAESSIEMKITGKVLPLAQWEVTGEMRHRLKVAFDKAGIEIPYPQLVNREASKKRAGTNK